MFNHTIIKRSLAVALTAAAATFPAAAQAQYAESSGGGASASELHITGPQPPASIASVSSTQSGGSSFQWGDAGIGAAGAVVLMGGAALGATRRRRVQRPVVG